jgi:hypothetical protein
MSEYRHFSCDGFDGQVMVEAAGKHAGLPCNVLLVYAGRGLEFAKTPYVVVYANLYGGMLNVVPYKAYDKAFKHIEDNCTHVEIVTHEVRT